MISEVSFRAVRRSLSGSGSSTAIGGYTLPVALANLVSEHVQDTELMMAGSVLTIIPVLLVFLFLRRSYIQGVMAGSVKG